MFNKKIILASASPRRAELLTLAGIQFEVCASNIEEIIDSNLPPTEIVKDLAAQKSAAVHQKETGQITLGADTIVVLENEILGKPKDLNEAKKMLHKLSGKNHEVITGVAINYGENKNSFAVVTNVFFKELSIEQIDYYVQNFQPIDKAGAYAIQEYIGAVGIEKIEGDYYNVVGLPVQRVVEVLEKILK